ncbi:hypothetical protein PHET_02699 [Paragonimus heterotremus]|uniref:TIR domain-containing protein n=1 Tax=Paragonimus heterotremus TaxID=100268 RepID=A0A8J4TCV0_9TREM|nr:hypothetical protein PHET_02699 [Paragonimus heterotremus]
MDHPEPITKRPMDIPQCRKSFTLEEARTFIDQVMEVFHSLEDMTDLRSMYETGKQLSRAYFDCHSFRAELAQHLTNCEYPAFASKMMKKLNNMGVFKNDDIWFSSFYFYNTTWNFSDTWPDFATALASAGLPNLLNLNIDHQPYLENLSSKNVYYLIKASLSIIHNIARVPGNTHYFTSESVRQALLHLAQREEEFLRCVSALCLAHIITESETHLVTDSSSGGIDLARVLLGYINSARVSEKRRCHGFQVVELLCALSSYSVHDTVKTSLLSINLSSTGGAAPNEQGATCIGLLKDLIETALLVSPSTVALREAEEAVRILWNLVIDPNTVPSGVQSQVKTWVGEVLNNPAAPKQFTKAMMRALETLHWNLSHAVPPAVRDEPTECGSILFSFAPSNRIAVNRIADRLRKANLPVATLPFASESLGLPEASVVGLSMCACNTTSRAQWFESLDQSPIMVACLSDAYRLSPGCRLEAEYFISHRSDAHPKPVVPIVLQPKLKPSGWVTRIATRHPIDFNGKRDPEASYEALISQLGELVSEAKKRAETAAVVMAAQRHSSVDGKRHMAIAGDTGVVAMSNTDAAINHVNGSAVGGSRATSGMSMKREDAHPIPTPNVFPYKVLNSSTSLSALTGVNPRLIPTSAWRHVIRPEVRNWSTSTVATWLRFRGLGHVSANMAGGIDGVLLSQLAGLRLWAPEYFNQSIRAELGLGFTDSLRFLEALDELAPEEDDKKLEDECDVRGDPHAHINAVDGAVSRS